MTAAQSQDEQRATVRRLIERQPAYLGLLQRVCLAAVEALSPFADVTVEALLDMQQDGLACDSGGASVLDVGHRADLFQAQGMVMMPLGVSIGEALVRLRAYAYAENRRLEDVARDIVHLRLRLNGNKE